MQDTKKCAVELGICKTPARTGARSYRLKAVYIQIALQMPWVSPALKELESEIAADGHYACGLCKKTA